MNKWLGKLVLGAMAVGLAGLMTTSPASATGLQHQYREREWRKLHHDWNGRYYYHNNRYYFDPQFSSPAVIENEYSTIGGGVVLNNDPYVSFPGAYGTNYPIASLNVDLASSDRNRRARALYFQRPYFYRNGTRYDRTVVTRNGSRFYRFGRHPN